MINPFHVLRAKTRSNEAKRGNAHLTGLFGGSVPSRPPNSRCRQAGLLGGSFKLLVASSSWQQWVGDLHFLADHQLRASLCSQRPHTAFSPTRPLHLQSSTGHPTCSHALRLSGVACWRNLSTHQGQAYRIISMKANWLGLFVISAKCLQSSVGTCVGLDNQRMGILGPIFRIVSTTPIMPFSRTSFPLGASVLGTSGGEICCQTSGPSSWQVSQPGKPSFLF